jgi:hypothetical protein
MALLNSVIFEEKHYNKFYNFFSLKTLLTIVKGRRVFTNFHLILLVPQKAVYVSSVSRFGDQLRCMNTKHNGSRCIAIEIGETMWI